MPQIWMTYDELADMLDTGAPAARKHAIEMGWSRRRSHDGQSRVKLPEHVAAGYLERCFHRRLAEMQASPRAVSNMQRQVAEAFVASDGCDADKRAA